MQRRAPPEGASDALGAARRLPRGRGARDTLRDALRAVLAKAGLAPSEAFALQPGDIDWGGRTVRVERAWNLGRVKPTKTYEERTVDLTPELVRARNT